MQDYIIGIDQSTQGTKALLFDGGARLIARSYLPHRQIISREGYISHDPVEIYSNTTEAVRKLMADEKIDKNRVRAIGISNQRETTAAWNRRTGLPVCDAVVWQCSRAKDYCDPIGDSEKEYIKDNTGIPLSPYFPALKAKWILENYPEAREMAKRGELCIGTMDSWLLCCLTGGREFKTDYSNASRTQLMNLHTLEWDSRICELLGIPKSALPEICDSDACFGYTDVSGSFTRPIPVYSMMGDSHAALYGQGCHKKGTIKATYGTGSSLMLNTGGEMISSTHGLVTSLAWRKNGEVNYVLEGNLNYTGAVITWLKDDLKLINNAAETGELAGLANPKDTTCLVPAFSGIGAPYWKSGAKAMLYGMSRTTGKNEIVKAALECIAYQIDDILRAMKKDSGIDLSVLCVDGGPTRNRYLMQFQSDISDITVKARDAEELSGIGAAYMAGISAGVFSGEQAFSNLKYTEYKPGMEEERRNRKLKRWEEAISKVIN